MSVLDFCDMMYDKEKPMEAADSKIWEEVPELAEALLYLARQRSAGSRARIASKRPKVKDCIEELTQMMQNAGLPQV